VLRQEDGKALGQPEPLKGASFHSLDLSDPVTDPTEYMSLLFTRRKQIQFTEHCVLLTVLDDE
jgi:hypothetical protein